MGVHTVILDWGITVTSIFLEVCGISLLLDWLLAVQREHRLEPQRQIALRRFFTAIGRNLFIELARINSPNKPLTKEDEIQLAAQGKVTPATNLPLHRYLVRLSDVTQHAVREIERLVDRFGGLFEPEFTNDLFQITEMGHHLIESGLFVKEWALSETDETRLRQVAERVNETFELVRRMLMRQCTLFVVKRLYPLANPNLQGLIRFHLLNFYVGYFPEICDIILRGERLPVKKPEAEVSNPAERRKR